MRKAIYLLILLAASSCGAGSDSAQPFPEPGGKPIATYDQISLDPYENVCRFGPPVAVFAEPEEDFPDRRFVIFAGPFERANGTVAKYAALNLAEPEADRAWNFVLRDPLGCGPCEARPDELARYDLVDLEAGVPDNVPALESRLGAWDFRIPISGTPAHRLVYERRLCFGDKLLAGAYFNVTDDRVFAAKGISDAAKFDEMRSEGAEAR